MPARFVFHQQKCSGPIVVTGSWDGGGDLNDGVAKSHCNGKLPDLGRATGRFRDGQLSMTIEWDTPGLQSTGIYNGTVGRDGKIGGTSYAAGHPEWGSPTWNSAEPLDRVQ